MTKSKYAPLIAACLAITISGCATQKTWSSVSGSKADGIVTLGYQHTWLEKPIISEQQGLALAKRKCKNWGYKNAVSFGAGTATCIAYGYTQYGARCNAQKVLRDYQCQ